MNSMAEKLNMVREAEEKARQIYQYYEEMAESTIVNARTDVESKREQDDAKARELGEREVREIIEHANKEAEELRIEYMYDRIRLRQVVVQGRADAIAYLVERLLKGD
jgi:vacuolar-type H+-ATPase subunit H